MPRVLKQIMVNLMITNDRLNDLNISEEERKGILSFDPIWNQDKDHPLTNRNKFTLLHRQCSIKITRGHSSPKINTMKTIDFSQYLDNP